MVRGTAAEVLKHRRNDEQTKKLAASRGIVLKASDMKPCKNKKYPYYTPARNNDVFNCSRNRNSPDRADVLLIRKYHRRNDIQDSILGSKCTTMYINENFHALHLRSTDTYQRLQAASSSQNSTSPNSPSTSTTRKSRKSKAQDFARIKSKKYQRCPSASKEDCDSKSGAEDPNPQTWMSSSKGLWSKFLALFMISSKCGRRRKADEFLSEDDKEAEEEELMKEGLQLSEYLEDFKPATIAKLDEFDYSEEDEL